MELLLRCVSMEPQVRQPIEMGELCRGLDWQKLLDLAEWHGITPLLNRALQTCCWDAVPAARQTELMERQRLRYACNSFFTGELLKLLDLFATHGIETIPFKGPVLTMALYGDLTLRDFGDLDLLVRPGDLKRAAALVIADGYAPRTEIAEPDQDSYMETECEQGFVKHDVLLELHWHLAGRYFRSRFDLAPLWHRTVTVSLGGREVPSFSSEDTLILLCVHGAKHLWGQLKWFCDVAELIRQPRKLDWQAVFDRAEGAGLERTLLLGLYLVNRLMHAELPELVRARIQRNPSVARSAESICGRLEITRERNLLSRVWFHVQRQARFREKLLQIYLIMTTPSETDRKFIALPARLSILYVILRPLRLLTKARYEQR